MNWEAIGVLLLVGVMMFFWMPGLLKTAKEAPKGSGKDWMGVLIPIALVVLFILFLISIV